MALFIISNRLPVKVSRTERGEYVFSRSEGGLATGLSSLHGYPDKHWVGWPGIYAGDDLLKKKIRDKLSGDKFHPVFLSEEQLSNFYEGYCNSTIWPLCHYFYTFIQFNSEYWETYKEVNRIFCEEAAKFIKPGDVVWVQDYQLMLLPAMLRAKIKNISIGYFHHIPFPSYELFRVLPERAVILNGLLGADLVGFHTYDYMRHFISTVYRVLGLDCELDEIHLGNRVIRVDAFPMGINYRLYHDAILNDNVQTLATQFREEFGNHQLILSVDRLDYSKGIIHRLNGFELFLKRHPEYHGKISLVMVVVPSRDTVKMYAELKAKIDEKIGQINGLYSSLDWRPVYYFYRSFPFDELVALYHIADTALVTPLRDGMNLVAKEYVAVKRDQPAVLILSEMAGASSELQDALKLNPNSVDDFESVLTRALNMPVEEKKERMRKMQATISKQTVDKWASDFISELKASKERNASMEAKWMDMGKIRRIRRQYSDAGRRLIILDYDGTLVPFVKNPEDAIPTPDVMRTLGKLTSDKRNTVEIISGRDAKFLDSCFGDMDIELSAEHGLFFKEDGRWNENLQVDFPEDDELYGILDQFVEKTPGSQLEKKRKSLVWHYRNCDSWLADLREKQLINALMNPCARLNLQIMRGNKIVEVKTMGTTKGNEVTRLLHKGDFSFIIALGDDVTDEDIFQALPESSITIKVGSVSDYAKYSLSQDKTLDFLSFLSGKKS